MPGEGIHRDVRDAIAQLLASPSVVARKPPRAAAWPLTLPEPPDARALYDACDGLTLASGLVLFGRGELGDVTQWLVLEKGLSWPTDLVVVGERRDTVIVLDLDVQAARAGGGVLEVANDDFGLFERVASGLVAYVALQAEAGSDPTPPPEIAGRQAAALADVAALESALARPMYPGHERLVASLAHTLGALLARAGHIERALLAFERSVSARVSGAGRGAREAERRAGWRAAALACRSRGRESLAASCEARMHGDADVEPGGL